MFKPGGGKARPGILWKERMIDLNAAYRSLEKQRNQAKTEFLWEDILDFLKEGERAGRRARRVLAAIEKGSLDRGRGPLVKGRGKLFLTPRRSAYWRRSRSRQRFSAWRGIT
jgi:hypothetical protein